MWLICHKEIRLPAVETHGRGLIYGIIEVFFLIQVRISSAGEFVSDVIETETSIFNFINKLNSSQAVLFP
jgi:hypothetical protein